MMSSVDFILTLLTVSEKAASIARACRQNEKLLTLLVQEKTARNTKCGFIADFKTLADVLIQELIRRDLEKKFPALKGSICGEENNIFTNSLGETVVIALNDDKSNTVTLLMKILNGDSDAAHLLADVVHVDVSINNVPVDIFPQQVPDINIDDLAVWIDPIDATYEYILGEVNPPADISIKGLHCVTVLIGVFSKSTGIPVVGVMNKPFHQILEHNVWKGHCVWGFSQEKLNTNSIPEINKKNRPPLIAVSVYEDTCIKEKLKDAGFELVSPAGAGNKCLCVILDKVDAYLSSQGTTYYWDTCACHALLKSLNGNIWNYREALNGNVMDIRYRNKCDSLDIKEYSNKGGLIAFRNEQLAQKIVNILQ